MSISNSSPVTCLADFTSPGSGAANRKEEEAGARDAQYGTAKACVDTTTAERVSMMVFIVAVAWGALLSFASGIDVAKYN